METQQNHTTHKHRGLQPAVTLLFLLAFTALLAIAAAVLLIWNGALQTKDSLSDVDQDGYQAVFLDNGQAYFGKLLPANNNEYIKLTDVWYLRTSETDGSASNKAQAPTTDSVNATIVKLGGEIHGPKDEMLISKSQVLFYENLKDDSKVVKAIKEDSR